jgi:quinoprotein glucose dehydrogenase
MIQNRVACAGVIISIGFAGTMAAQNNAARRTVSEGVYTQEQAERGKAAYEAQCSSCHLSDLSGQSFAPALIEDMFRSRWQEGTVGDLFLVVKQTMPQDKPASLTDAEYAEIVAFLLKSNQYPAGMQELPPDPKALNEVTFKEK